MTNRMHSKRGFPQLSFYSWWVFWMPGWALITPRSVYDGKHGLSFNRLAFGGALFHHKPWLYWVSNDFPRMSTQVDKILISIKSYHRNKRRTYITPEKDHHLKSFAFTFALHLPLLAGLESFDPPSSTSTAYITQLSFYNKRAALLIGRRRLE